MRVVFAGTPVFSLSSLEALIAHPTIEVVAVYTQPDRRSGRGKKHQASPVKQLALAHDIPVIQPESFKDPQDIDFLADLNPALIVVTAYGLILPPAVLAIPKLGCINIHASLLPRWRGAAPIQRAIEAGDQITGITLMQMEAGLDTGPMLARVELPIEESDTGGSLHDKLTILGGELLAESLDAIIEQRLTPASQNSEFATYASKLSKAESEIDWQQSAKEIACKIRALNPWPTATADLNENPLRLLQAAQSNETSYSQPGQIIELDKKKIYVATGEGVLEISELQKPGGKAINVKDFLNGTPLEPGMIFH